MRPDSPEGVIHRRGSRGMLPRTFEIVGYQRFDFMHIGGLGVTENEVFKTMKLDVASSAVSPF